MRDRREYTHQYYILHRNEKLAFSRQNYIDNRKERKAKALAYYFSVDKSIRGNKIQPTWKQLPEETNYSDTGCTVSSTCLGCTLPECVEV